MAKASDAARLRQLIGPFTVTRGDRFRLKTFDPDDTGAVESKDQAHKWLARDLDRLRELQGRLYARGT